MDLLDNYKWRDGKSKEIETEPVQFMIHKDRSTIEIQTDEPTHQALKDDFAGVDWA